jgi:hypothetical protein
LKLLLKLELELEGELHVGHLRIPLEEPVLQLELVPLQVRQREALATWTG